MSKFMAVWRRFRSLKGRWQVAIAVALLLVIGLLGSGGETEADTEEAGTIYLTHHADRRMMKGCRRKF